jgi:hypothetical protein
MVALAIVALFSLGTGPTFAQTTGNNNNNNNNNNDSTNATGAAGVEVDAQGVLQKKVFIDQGGVVWRQRVSAAKASLNRSVIPFSECRKISLNRLEEAIRAKDGSVTQEMKHLAGLLRVRYVFYYPETNDIVIAGPAEGWATDAVGRTVGITSHRPVIQIEDLAVALRAFPPGKKGAENIGCSIDPTPEGLANMQHFLKSFGSTFHPSQKQQIEMMAVEGLRNSLGMQKVTVHGVSPKSHFAQVLVEADYRMKLIGIGLEQPPVRMVSFIEKAKPAQVSRNALFRWYFVPDYNCVRVAEDGLGMELVGDGVKLIGQDEMVTNSGERRTATGGNSASQAFVTSFTQRYSALAERSPVYAELRNLIDLSVAAAFIQKEDYYGKANWKMPVLGSEKALPVETLTAPTQVESVVAAVNRGNTLMTPIAGGVEIHAVKAIKPENVLTDEGGKVTKRHEQLKPQLSKGQWWWD